MKSYDNFEQIILDFLSKAERGQVNSKYFRLISLIREWKIIKWLNSDPEFSIRKVLAVHLDNIGADKLYGMWIFFQILEVLKPVKQIRENKSLFKDEYGVSIEYHKQLDIGWILEKAGGFTSGVKRYPDITISKTGKHSIIVDAKCMQYSEVTGSNQEPGPDRNIVNQMLVYMDYDKSRRLGIVAFADKSEREDIRIYDVQSRQILFLNCYPSSKTQERFSSRVKTSLGNM